MSPAQAQISLRMGFVMNKKLMVLLMPVILGACTYNNTSNSMTAINEFDLQHHNWTLVQIDDDAMTGLKNKPHLEIGENMRATGFAGCNNFFGQSVLNEDQFRIEKMGMSQKMCFGKTMEIENILSVFLTQNSTITLSEKYLELNNGAHTLTFRLDDYK